MRIRHGLGLMAVLTASGMLGVGSAGGSRPAKTPARAAGSAAVSRPAITGVAFIMLRTSNLDAAREYYGHVLGLSEADSGKTAGSPSSDGGSVPSDEADFLKPHAHLRFYANAHQYVELIPGLASADEDRLVGIGFETANAKELSAYLQSHGVKILGSLPAPDTGFVVKDPEGRLVAFVEVGRAPAFSRQQEANVISRRMIHVGFVVKDQMLEDRFYRDILNFKEVWHGGMTDTRADWVDMRVPDGKDWLEYMLNVNNPTPKTRGVMDHLALGVPSVAAAYKDVLARGYKAGEPKIGRDGKWQLNLYDPDLTRAEFMEPKPVEKPCCSTFVTQ